MKRSIRTILAAGAVAVATPLAVAGPVHAETFHSSRMVTTWTPWNNPNDAGSGSYNWPINSGTSVNMRCWTTGLSRLGTSKWFYVNSNAYPYSSGYVPANAVGNQWLSSPHC